MDKLISSLHSALASLLQPLENLFDRLKYRRPGRRRIVIQAYRGFGASQYGRSGGRLFLKGRVLEDPGVRPATPADGLWVNLGNAYKRFESDEIPHARLQVCYSGHEIEVVANEEGFFEVDMQLRQPLDRQIVSHLVDIALIEPLRPGHLSVKTRAEVIVPAPSARFGILSDVDDTVILTRASNPMYTIWNLVSRNAYTRIPIPGAAAFYTALWQGVTGAERNPIFYVSTSPWNIYDQLEQFLQLQDFPPKPVFHLRDWGLTQREIIPTEHHEHKKGFIRLVLEMYPQMPLILIGDSSLQDPEIYAEISREHPGRVLAVYLREVTQDPQVIERIHRLRGRLARRGIPVILAEHVLPMAQHAAQRGWISLQSLAKIHSVNTLK